MTSAERSSPARWRPWLDALGAPAVGVAYFLAVRRFHPHDAFSLNPDEGTNSMKAMLVDHGYRLYEQIWSDQPPLFTHLLHAWFDAFGADVEHGRSLVLLFAALLMCVLYDLLRRSWSHAAAAASVVLLAASAYFVPLSVSLMIGLPSLTCAMLALYSMVRWRHARSGGWLVASGIAMSVSFGIKLFTAFLIPVFALWLFATARSDGRPRPWQPALSWLLVVCGCSAMSFLALIGPVGLEQLVVPHAEARVAEAFSARRGLLVLGRVLPVDAPLVLLALLGTLRIVQRRCPDLFLLPLWAGAAVLLLVFHAPVWHHHYLLLSIAAVPCAGVAVAALFEASTLLHRPGGARSPLVLRLAVAGALLLLAFTLPISRRASRPEIAVTWEAAQDTLDAMKPFKSRTHFVLTDSPMYAFRSGLLTVPHLAVVSLKRKETHHLTTEDLLTALERYAPEQVLLTDRFHPGSAAAVTAAVQGGYDLVFRSSRDQARLYVRNDIVDLAKGNGRSSPGS